MNKNKNVWIFIDYPLSRPWAFFLGLNNASKNFQFTLIKMATTKQEEEAFKYEKNNFLDSSVRVLTIRSTLEYLTLLKMKNGIIIDLTVSNRWFYIFLNKYLRKNSSIYIKFAMAILPLGESIGAKKKLTSFRKYSKVIRLIKRKIFSIFALYDYVFFAGDDGKHYFPKRFIEAKSIASFDYLNYVNYLNKIKEDDRDSIKYALLIEENLVDDPDFLITNDTGVKNTYYACMYDCLKSLEKMTGLPVKVLPHPKSDLSRLENVFHGFEILKVETAAAISGAEFVITHFSTAISYALLADKPILLLDVPHLKDDMRRVMMRISNILGLRTFYADELLRGFMETISLANIDESRKNDYISSYIFGKNANPMTIREILEYVQNIR